MQCLLRNADSGRYYARWTVRGKQKWVNLKTDVFTVAKLRLYDELAKIEALRHSGAAVAAGKGNVGDLMALHEQEIRKRTDLKPGSIAARLVALKKLRKSWPELESMKQTQVTPDAVGAWAQRFKAEGTKFRPPGAKTVIAGNSATSVNRAVDTLRRLMDIAVARGAIHRNPVTVPAGEDRPRLKLKVEAKKLELPGREDMHRLFEAIENNGARGGWGVEAADFCRFMALTGCRVGEVPAVTWACVDREKKMLHIRGTKSDTSDRQIPIFPDLDSLLGKVIERRKRAAIYSVDGKPMIGASDPLFRLSECQKTLDRACETLGIKRITHHDLRHLFATRCIESGVDVPTVSRWLGHADGGALAMKTYGHLRQEHSQAQALRVNF